MQKHSLVNSKFGLGLREVSICASGQKLEEIKHIIYCDFEKFIKWFHEKYLMLNQSTSHFMCLGRNTEKETFVF